MTLQRTPRWLLFLERKMGWLSIPNLGVIFVTLQGMGFFASMTQPGFEEVLILDPTRVMAGEVWRLFTFLAVPISRSAFWVIFVLFFLYFILQMIEAQWGAFRTTFYVLFSMVVTWTFSLVTGYPVVEASNFESTLFLAAASLFPEMEVQLFFFIPVKMKYLAALTGVMAGINFVQGGLYDRIYLLCVYSGFLLFFGPAMVESIRLRIRRARYKKRMDD